MSKDRIYTPADLAKTLIAASRMKTPARIADFAAGDGALLKAALQRWPDAEIFGSDLDLAAVAVLETMGPAIRCDFLDNEELEKIAVDERVAPCFPLILLNPPFSCRPCRIVQVAFGTETLWAGPALAFVANATRFLQNGGEIVAILPTSVLTSQRDSKLLGSIRRGHSIEIIGEILPAAFKGHSVRVTIVRFTKLQTDASNPIHLVASNEFLHSPSYVGKYTKVAMLRGSLAVNRAPLAQGGVAFVHTTSLRNRSVHYDDSRVTDCMRKVSGSAVLIPRVGRPSVEKVALKLDDTDCILSDCVIALSVGNLDENFALHKEIVSSWSHLENSYVGSCAPYLTLVRLSAFLHTVGYSTIAVEAISSATSIVANMDVA
jgi:hypothetical protein